MASAMGHPWRLPWDAHGGCHGKRRLGAAWLPCCGNSFRLLKDLHASPFGSLKDLLGRLKDLLASPFAF